MSIHWRALLSFEMRVVKYEKMIYISLLVSELRYKIPFHPNKTRCGAQKALIAFTFIKW